MALRNVTAWLLLGCSLLGLAASSRAAGPSDLATTKAAFRVSMLLPRSIAADGWTRAGYNGLLLIKKKLGAEVAFAENSFAVESPRAAGGAA